MSARVYGMYFGCCFTFVQTDSEKYGKSARNIDTTVSVVSDKYLLCINKDTYSHTVTVTVTFATSHKGR